MLQRVWRQRRRLIFCAVILAIAAAMLAPVAWPAYAIGSAGIGVLLMSALVIVSPERRWSGTKVCVLILLVALANVAFSDAIPVPAMAAGGAALAFLLPSQLWILDEIRLPWIVKARVQVTLNVDAVLLWEAVFPKETRHHWDPTVAGIVGTRQPDHFFFIYDTNSYHDGLRVPIKVMDVEPMYHFKMRDLSGGSVADGAPVSLASYVIEPKGRFSELTLMEATWQQGIWTAFSQWMDDYLADYAMGMTAQLEESEDWSIKGKWRFRAELS